MNLPTKLTVLRIVMIPLFVAAYFVSAIPFNYLIAAVIFALAAFTDFLDGFIARKYGMVTDLGKFLDPVADKVLVASALVIMLVTTDGGTEILPWYGAIAVVIILARELIVSGFRMVAAGKNVVLAAEKSGKIKTVVQDFSVIVLLLGAQFQSGLYTTVNIVGLCLMALATVLTVISGAECIIKNAGVLKENK